MNSFGGNSNLDNLLLQTLMGRLQIRLPHINNNNNNNNNNQHSTSQAPSFEDLLFNAINNGLSDSDDDEADGEGRGDSSDSRTQLAKEEAKLEKEIIRVILSGKTDSLKPNSGQAVTVGEHHICIGFHEEKGSDYRVWEWHGHIMLFDEENGYTPEYIYGNYFERLPGKSALLRKEAEDKQKQEEEEAEKLRSSGLKELIDSGDSAGSRILHRSVNMDSARIG